MWIIGLMCLLFKYLYIDCEEISNKKEKIK